MTARELSLPPHVQAKLDEAVRVIVEHTRPQLIILFGSYAEGRQHADSDLDLLVVAETDSWHRLSVHLRKALRPVLSPLSFDLLVYPPQAWERDRRVRGFVARDADLKGVRLHAA